jgi:lipopolysaccharide/colanic/teichoic acid biosynthesis glycosyltransferase
MKPYLFVKRLGDILVSALLTTLLAPVFLGIALAIWMTDGRPILFRQERLGHFGSTFSMFKFRTMKQGAPDLRNADGTTFNSRTDPRVTGIGRFLRRTSLDELPQLWNVLLGDMSLVGGRPDLPEALGRYTPEQRRRLDVRPGMTSWAIIHGRNNVPLEERWALDAWYATHVSLRLDLEVVVRTAILVVTGDGVTRDQAAGTGPTTRGD